MYADTTPGSDRLASSPAPGVSVVVPVFNSDQTLSELVGEIVKVLTGLDSPFEILLVDDGSADSSWDRILEMVASDSRVRGIRLSRNFGQHNATLCGIRQAAFDTCVTLDDDLQHPPSAIPRLLQKLGEGWDVVYGRIRRPQHFWLRDRLAAMTKTAVDSVTGLDRVSRQSPFRAFRTELRQAFVDYRGPDVLLDILLGWGTARFTSVEIEHRPVGTRRTSRYTAGRLLDMGILALTAYSTRPLRLASWLGFSLTVFGVLILGYVVAVAVFVGSVPGFPFLASLISIFSGTQLFTLGLFGEYLSRTFNRALGVPTYVVREMGGVGEPRPIGS